MGPELNPIEERQLADLIELQIDTAIEESHTHENLTVCPACGKLIGSLDLDYSCQC